MSINEHAQTFAGCKVVQWEPGKPIQDPAGACYRISVEYEDENSWLEKFGQFLKTDRSEAQACHDALVRLALGRPEVRFVYATDIGTGFDWPAGDCLPQTGGIQFHRGYGLSIGRRSTLGRLPESEPVVACPAGSR